jgi:hypothetical protein
MFEYMRTTMRVVRMYSNSPINNIHVQITKCERVPSAYTSHACNEFFSWEEITLGPDTNASRLTGDNQHGTLSLLLDPLLSSIQPRPTGIVYIRILWSSSYSRACYS